MNKYLVALRKLFAKLCSSTPAAGTDDRPTTQGDVGTDADPPSPSHAETTKAPPPAYEPPSLDKRPLLYDFYSTNWHCPLRLWQETRYIGMWGPTSGAGMKLDDTPVKAHCEARHTEEMEMLRQGIFPPPGPPDLDTLARQYRLMTHYVSPYLHPRDTQC